MTGINLTPTRVALLQDIADPASEVYASIRRGGSWSTADVYVKRPNEIDRKVTKHVAVLENAGLVARGPGGARYHERRPYSLTPEGEQALAHAMQDGNTR